MSIKVSALVWDCYEKGGGEMLLALAIADRANDDGAGVWQSVVTFARLTRQSERTVQYQLRKMEAEGWLERDGKRPVGRGGYVQIYRISAEWIAGARLRLAMERIEQQGAKSAPCSSDGVQSDVDGVQKPANGVQSSAQRGAIAVAPETSLDPSIEPKDTSRIADATAASYEEADDRALAEWLFGLVLALNPGHRAPSWSAWCRDIRLMRERDGRSRHDIAAAFRWANGHDFWRRNILSPAALRKQWDRIVIERGGAKPAAPAVVHAVRSKRCTWMPDGAAACERPATRYLGLGLNAPGFCAPCWRAREEHEARTPASGAPRRIERPTSGEIAHA